MIDLEHTPEDKLLMPMSLNNENSNRMSKEEALKREGTKR